MKQLPLNKIQGKGFPKFDIDNFPKKRRKTKNGGKKSTSTSTTTSTSSHVTDESVPLLLRSENSTETNMSVASSCNIDLVIKFGGSAITEKHNLETINNGSLQTSAELVRNCILNGRRCIIVHGAGSFGHHHAKLYKIPGGFTHLDVPEEINKFKLGYALTRQSVLKLNAQVIEELLKKQIPAVTISPCSSWRTDKKKEVIHHGCHDIQSVIENGLVPVLHGDCVFDKSLGATILSGDTIIQKLCEWFNVKKVVFLTDVDGIYDKPPTLLDAKLIPNIEVKSKSETVGEIVSAISTSTANNDVTGGISLKLQTALDIVTQSNSTQVYICRVNSKSAQNVCVSDSEDQEFIGTKICYNSKNYL